MAVIEENRAGKITLLIISGLGLGANPDAEMYGERGANTLSHIAEEAGGLPLTAFSELGLGNLVFIRGTARQNRPVGFYGRMRQRSPGKDEVSGFREIMGIHSETSFQPVPEDPEAWEALLVSFMQQSNMPILLHKEKDQLEKAMTHLYADHAESKKPVIFSPGPEEIGIAAFQDVISAEEFFTITAKFRTFLDEQGIRKLSVHYLSGTSSGYQVLDYRLLYPAPESASIIQGLHAAHIPRISIGSGDGFLGDAPFDQSFHAHDYRDSMETLLQMQRDCPVNEDGKAVILTYIPHLREFYPARNNLRFWCNTLKEIDVLLTRVMRNLPANDILMVTSDHGADPRFPDTCTREQVPLLIFAKYLKTGRFATLDVRKTFADVSETIADLYDIPYNFGAVSCKNHIFQGLNQGMHEFDFL